MRKSYNQLRVVCTIALASCFTPVIRAQEIKPYKAEEIKPYNSTEVTNERNDKNESAHTGGSVKPESFFGLYQYWVPGTSYTVPDYANHQTVIYNSSGTGVLPGGIKINKDGTYIWNSSWEGKVIRGKWMATGNTDYPIELQNAQEGKNWKVGKATDKSADIVVWDGSTWYNGKRVETISK